MNTNSKHYEILAIEPWEIMERNFTTEEFVAYLKGNIIKYTLRDKGQALTDAEKIKHYAEKLIEVLEKKDMDEFLDEDAERIYGDYGYGQEDEPEPVEEPEGEHKFEIGDRVRAYKDEKLTGIIVRVPTEGYTFKDSYLVELDNKSKGWTATLEEDGVDAKNVWGAYSCSLELLEPLNEEPTPALIPNLWYDASLYTVDKLKELLPVGTKVFVLGEHDNDREVNLGKESALEGTVERVDKRVVNQDTRIAIEESDFFRRYFQIIE